MKKTVIILLHIGYWVVYLLLLLMIFALVAPHLRDAGQPLDPATSLLHWSRFMLGFAVIPGLLGFYGFYTILFDRFLREKKIKTFFAGAIGSALFSGSVGAVVWYVMFTDIAGRDGPNVILMLALLSSFIALLNGVVGLVMKGFVSWYGDIRLKEELARRNYEMEIALIKAQLNPHFLFNTINNIDVLIRKNPEKASLYLNQLSDMLRFMLYETKTEEIALSSELDYIEKYIQLQRIRTSNPEFVSYRVEGNTGGRRIAPMLFIPFIENAFKYASNKKIENAIAIYISINDRSVKFSCRNEFQAETRKEPSAGGLGNSLIRRRLELLYPAKHQLTLRAEHNTYLAELEVFT